MAVSLPFSAVTVGGSGTNNPPNYSWTTFNDYPNLDLGRSYQRVNVIFFDAVLKVNLEVTGLAVIQNGQTMTGPNDSCFLPCPPSCG